MGDECVLLGASRPRCAVGSYRDRRGRRTGPQALYSPATLSTLGSGFSNPTGVAVDGSGDIYVADFGNNAVKEIVAVGGVIPANPTINTLGGGFTNPRGVAVDGSGNVYVADAGLNAVKELNYATPPSLTFATTPEGSTSSDSPQTITLDNDGNAPLALSGLSTASANFTLSGSSTCTSSTSLATNSPCTIGVTFAPTVPGSPLTDAVTITDNNLNVTGAVQTAPLSGTGTQQTAIVTVAPMTISYSTASTTLSASIAYLGSTAPSGAVSFTVDGGSAVLATCAESSSPLTCTASYSTATLSATFTSTDTTDYSIGTATVTLLVNQATPAITWPVPAAITYGTALSGAQLNATASVAGTFSYSPAAGVLTAGSQLLSVTFTPTDTTDYTTATATVTLVVTQVTPTISWSNPVAIAYGTHLSAAQLNATTSVPGAFSYNPALGTVLGAGTHTLSVTFTPTDTTDYTTAMATMSITVAPVALNITAGSPTMTYGSTLPTITPSYSGFISGDSASSLTTQPACTTTATSASNVGSYPTSCSGAVDANYIIGYKPGTLTITPAVLTVAANPLTFAYGGGDGDNDEDDVTNPMTYTITGFAPGQTAATDLTGKPSEISNTPEGGPVGSYTITMAAGSLKLKPAYSSDYTISYVSAPLIITPAVTVTATSQSDVYGAVDPDNCGNVSRHLTYTISGFAYNQSQYQVLYGSPTETTTATAKSSVGTYPITITQGSLALNRNYASNYTLVFVNGTLTVTPAKLTVVANSYSRQINQPNPAFGYTINGFVNGDNQSNATTGAPACCSTTATTTSPAGDYAISIAPGSLAAKNGNYTLTFVNGVLIIYNPNNRNDPHCDGFGHYNPNPQYDNKNWPDNSSYNYYCGNGGGGPNINNRPW